jgi:peptide-methionine (S)-S-oxide reductase
MATQVATFGAGCYWCVEAVLQQLDGVLELRSGFMGGAESPGVVPSYEEVCSGRTGHAEVVQLDFDPARVTYDELLAWFWRLHDPTTRDRQGADVGSQYRSVIFTHDAEQLRLAEASRDAASASEMFEAPIVTEIVPAGPFHAADASHQDYYRRNSEQRYCQLVIAPKLGKLGLEH